MRTVSSTHYRRCLAAGLLLLACGGSNPPPAGSSITVTGRLVDGFGKPLAGRTVLVGALSTNSDANGSFSASPGHRRTEPSPPRLDGSGRPGRP